MKRTVQNRAFDHLYDPVYTTRSSRGTSTTTTNSSNSSSLKSHLQGTQRYKYFKKPLIPYLESDSPTIVLAKQEEMSSSKTSRNNDEDVKIGKTRTVGVQTKYRDSEAQTDPFTPSFTLKPGQSRPEVLSIADMTFDNKGLPAGLKEIERIEHEREKKAYEASLPPMTDEVSFMIRRKMMERQERNEFNRREAEIEEANREHLRMIRNALDERESLNESRRQHRVETLRMSKLLEKDRLVSEVCKMRNTNLRKLSTKRQIAESKLYNPKQKRNVIRDYTNFASNVYAPIKRLGATMPSQQHLISNHKADFSLNSLRGLEHTLPRKIKSMDIPEPVNFSTTRNDFRPMNTKMRKENNIRMHLERTARSLNNNENDDTITTWSRKEDEEDEEEDVLEDTISSSKKKEKEKEAKTMTNSSSRRVRPPTPDVDEEFKDDDGDDEMTTHAITILQKLLRGRAVQNIMHEGVNQNRDLILELRHEDDYEEEEDDDSSKKKDDEDHVEWQQNEVIQSTREKLIGEIVSSTLGYITKDNDNIVEDEEVKKTVQSLGL